VGGRIDVNDGAAMERAVTLAAAARTVAPPNPWVGCVLVRDGSIVGQGATEAPGGPHAEAAALNEAGDRARGATAFVTLEPCSHHGRTAPCADALIAAGVTRVVAALEDPDPRVAGAGLARLRDAGIVTEVGLGAETVRRQLAPYLHHRLTGRAYCVLKTAVSIDGRIAGADRLSQWITGNAARADAHRLRAESNAIVVGAGTAIADHPALTVRGVDPPVRPPLRVVLDGRGRVTVKSPLADVALAPTLVITTAAAPREYVKQWLATGADIEEVATGPNGTGVDLHAVLEILGARDVVQALVEGGATIAGALLDTNLVNRLVTYVGGVTLGENGLPMATGGPPTLAGAPRWKLTDVSQVGECDARLDWEPA
jgi:diaminohydroxyphosphoribosylaminopyrimidine deaminase/5-amino-6-(5-phosphoribosylamino)uracil reductase